MEIHDAVVVVTGGASGIGAALARRFHGDGARHVVVVDRDADGARAVAAEVGGVAEQVDVADADAVAALVTRTLDREGRIDLFCSNAGRTTGVGVASPELWQAAWDLNVMAHVHAARAVLPAMLERGRGHLLQTASAAGLLTSPGDAPYAVTKHGAVAFAEWLAVTYGDRGIGVSVLCPMGVSTPLLMDPLAAGEAGAQAVAASGDIVSAEHVADVVAAGLAGDRFLLLPHPEVGTFWAQKASSPDRWLAGVRRLVSTDRSDNEER
ncbi:NADP-dependent 3-hydroxy acid dehydrogenase YdfG [Jatrophihabitans endophyticus]|uniref:NADP-dependent 3-hydroxy acid dehydrogenase YdfG n=1 Tax=Jatrophihabitans endophyticus TaxID=1206085 RepID=A0A1M5LH54_9ACTN|nr:SDR family oxidoreductase [Jatrophihabitans endophyticus]SHG64296.1 NADP-dependent 3-hydroxy acid dehydrogenase YdfG [Jatrophihabitans endophyticus]